MLAAAVALALSYWGPTPCTPVVHVHALERGVLGQTTRMGDWCEVEIQSRTWRWGMLCSVVVHEMGHAAGHGHSTDRMDVMYPELVRTADVCRGRRPPQFGPGAVIRLEVTPTRSQGGAA